jgi:hypothetical protein
MFLYTIIEAIAGIVAFILFTVRTKKDDSVVYNKLDKVGRITNILLIPIYACVLPFCLFLGMISYPAYDGFLGIIGWIVAIINASATLFCGLGLGLSVALRKKGKSKLGFAVQFVGLVGIALTIVMYMIFAGNLLKSLN